MATTVNTFTPIVTTPAYPAGSLTWWALDVSVDAADTTIQASDILSSTRGNLILDVADGGGANLVLNGAATGLTLVCNTNSGAGNIMFRSNLDGTPVAAIGATANLLIQVLVRN